MKSITAKGMCIWCIFLATNGPLGAELKFRENTVSGWGGYNQIYFVYSTCTCSLQQSPLISMPYYIV